MVIEAVPTHTPRRITEIDDRHFCSLRFLLRSLRAASLASWHGSHSRSPARVCRFAPASLPHTELGCGMFRRPRRCRSATRSSSVRPPQIPLNPCGWFTAYSAHPTCTGHVRQIRTAGRVRRSRFASITVTAFGNHKSGYLWPAHAASFHIVIPASRVAVFRGCNAVAAVLIVVGQPVQQP